MNLKLKQEVLEANQKLKILEQKVKKTKQIVLPECKTNSALDKNLTGKSFDSSHMRSTLHNMDLEEICRCYSRVIENQCKKPMGKANSVIKEYNSAFCEENELIPDENNIYY